MNQNKTQYIPGELIEIKNNTSSEIYSNDKVLPPNYIIKFLDKSGVSSTTEVYSEGNKYSVGDRVYVKQVQAPDSSYIALGDKIRSPEIYGSIFIFCAVVISIFGLKGFRALFSLTVSFLVIFLVLIPAMAKGYNPVLLSAGIATLLLALSMFITHGKSKVTYAALLGCSISIFITVLMSYAIIIYSKLGGYTDAGSYYIENGMSGPGSYINLSFLIIASIIIGVIGAVDDGAITQAKIVEEIKTLNKNITNYDCYKRAMNIGRDHGGAMINTLILAYVASSIPQLMFLYTSDIPLNILLNSEVVATEIFRATISSIGLLLAIPLTTYFAVRFIKVADLKDRVGDSHGHSHLSGHSH